MLVARVPCEAKLTLSRWPLQLLHGIVPVPVQWLHFCVPPKPADSLPSPLHRGHGRTFLPSHVGQVDITFPP